MKTFWWLGSSINFVLEELTALCRLTTWWASADPSFFLTIPTLNFAQECKPAASGAVSSGSC